MNALVQQETRALAAPSQHRMAVADIISHVATVQEVMRAVMKGPSKEHPQGVHYGIIPGTDKPTLLKPGAEVLCMAFRIADSYQIEDLSTADAVRYRVTCTGTHQTTGVVLGTGMGEASSGEEKYKWRKAYEPEYNETPPNLRRKKQGYNKQKRESYTTFQVRTEPADLANTILKMANKRAKMAMVLNVTAASDCFSQDLEDMDEALRDHLARHGGADDDDTGAGGPPPPPPPATLPACSDELFAQRLPEWRAAIKAKKATVDGIVAKARTKYTLTEAQEAAIREPMPADTPAADVTDTAPKVTYAVLEERIRKAQDLAALADAGTLIAAIADAQQRQELDLLFDQRGAELRDSN